ncbi:hypothetical protein AQUCO_10400001v1 [Aquilegia coerulea]|uniref:Uncharacterized protein n=1 Tax=Aquilegia coerulea TaxID=218851 RepID=A0A2G5C3N8_AQUCA|nr:hypothetical protein AQUCO_10400001v1 [Aquilegia coerulea]
MAGIVIVFDFDETIIDCDSDNWVVDNLGATKFVPLHPSTISAIKSAKALGCDLRIVSDANLFFIETVLKHQDLMGCFSEIHTNPSFVDEVGRLRILPYHDFNTSSHGLIERIKGSALADGKKHFIYLGDGKGDFCPSTKLRAYDFVMPRKSFPVWDLICSHPSLVKAGIHEWSSWDDQERILLHLINTIIFDDIRIPSSLIVSDCKFETIPISTQESLQQIVSSRLRS